MLIYSTKSDSEDLKMKYKIFLSSFSIIYLIFSLFSIVESTNVPKPSVEIIADFTRNINVSGDKEQKAILTKEALINIIDKLDTHAKLGITLIGHKNGSRCDYKERLVIGKQEDKIRAKKKIHDISSSGLGSMSFALNDLFQSTKTSEVPRNIILITDGKTTCDDELIKTARQIKDIYDYNVFFNIIAINPSKIDRLKLDELSKHINGTFNIIEGSKNVRENIENVVEKIKNQKIHIPKIVKLDDMVLIPEGEFLMGSTNKNDDPNEQPAHTVYLDSFYIDKYEVTQRQFKDVMGYNPSLWIGSDLPVERVSWFEAKEFCEKVGKRLPTEAEWEKAAKGGRNDRWPGTNVQEELIEYSWNDDTGAQGRTHPVGLKKPNGYGIYDMSGNVYEWVSDWFSFYTKESKKNPKGPEKAIYKVLRGGCWDNHTYEVRTTSRYVKTPEVKFANNGFRCARSSKQNE